MWDKDSWAQAPTLPWSSLWAGCSSLIILDLLSYFILFPCCLCPEYLYKFAFLWRQWHNIFSSCNLLLLSLNMNNGRAHRLFSIIPFLSSTAFNLLMAGILHCYAAKYHTHKWHDSIMTDRKRKLDNSAKHTEKNDILRALSSFHANYSWFTS